MSANISVKTPTNRRYINPRLLKITGGNSANQYTEAAIDCNTLLAL
jgi:hypothetical protein